MILTVDVGNTNIVLGGFLNNELKFVSRIATNRYKTEDEYASKIMSILHLNNIQNSEITGSVISSVVPPLNHILKNAIKKAYNVNAMIVGPGIKTGINLLVDNPSSVGADMICACVAAHNMYSGASLILDMGTATKMMVVDENGAFLGVSIIPGVQIGIQALASTTAQLPQISLEAPKLVIAKNTTECMRSGVVYGNASMVDGMIDRIKKEIGKDMNIIATGGLSKSIIEHCFHKIVLDEHLLLNGLNIIYNKNNDKEK